jgi:nitrogen-specific signal transduction histidine kinase
MVGEAKWSSAPFADAAIDRLAVDLENRPLPPGVPPDAERVLFVPAIRSRMRVTRSGVRIVTARMVMHALR